MMSGDELYDDDVTSGIHPDLATSPPPRTSLREALARVYTLSLPESFARPGPAEYDMADSVLAALRQPAVAAALARESARGDSPEAVAQMFHESYERLAPAFGYETREASAKPWADVPETNRRLMVAVAGEVLARLAARARGDAELEALDEAVGRVVGVAGAIAEINHDGNLDPKHPFLWPDLDAALSKLAAVRGGLHAAGLGYHGRAGRLATSESRDSANPVLHGTAGGDDVPLS